MADCFQVVLQSRCSQWRNYCVCGIVANAILQTVKGFVCNGHVFQTSCQQNQFLMPQFSRSLFFAVRHHSPLLNICEGLGGLFVKVADVLLQSERRTAVAKSRETITRGKVVKIRFRAPRRDKGTRGARKPYDIKRRKVARNVIMSVPSVVGLVVGSAGSKCNHSGEGGITFVCMRFPRSQRSAGALVQRFLLLIPSLLFKLY